MQHLPIPPSPQHLALLQQVVRSVVRTHRLRRADAEDFAQSVQLKLIESDYEMFRQFSGRSSLRTYLTVVVTRLLLDWRNKIYGKWRASAAAVRLGPAALSLERLVQRDGYSVQEAIACLTARDSAVREDDLERLAEQLPQFRRPRFVTADVLGDLPDPSAEDPVEAATRRRTARRIKAALVNALRELPDRERQLVLLRYRGRRSVKEIAEMLQTDQKQLYRRFERALRGLKKSLTAQGVTGATTILDVIG